MSWEPIYDGHAIHTVRLLVNFSDALPNKVLISAQSDIKRRQSELELDTIQELTGSASNQITFAIAPTQPPQVSVQPGAAANGLVFQKTELDEGEVKRIEEVGVRPRTFGYVAEKYERWSNFESRFFEIFSSPLAYAFTVESVGAIQLEYRNVFVYTGQGNYAGLELFQKPFAHIPPDAISEDKNWQVRLTFAKDDLLPGLGAVFDREYRGARFVRDETKEEFPAVELVNSIHLVSPDAGGVDLDIDGLRALLDQAHNALHLRLMDTLSPEMNERLNLDRENYT